MKHTYTIKEDNSDVKKIVITKTGWVSDFTLEAIDKHVAELQKMLVEQKKMAELSSAKMKNIEHFHPDITSLDDEKLHHAFLYYKLKQENKTFTENVAEISKGLTEYDTERHEIIDQLDLKEKVVESEKNPHATEETSPEEDTSEEFKA